MTLMEMSSRCGSGMTLTLGSPYRISSSKSPCKNTAFSLEGQFDNQYAQTKWFAGVNLFLAEVGEKLT